jgi:two-component system OmpR family response regulator
MDTVLIVDDSSFIVEGLIAFLKKQYRPIAAYGGAECLDILSREIPSVIILDIMMEPMDGWETLARIKENPATRNIPVLMFSAKKISPEEAEEHRMRIDDFITKPVSPKKIIEAIEKVLARRDTNRKVVEAWKSSGISQEKIDEYLSLVSSLEVDLSLCQNMKIQYDLVHPEDKNQDEFQSVITAIEDRIRHERELIETMAREMKDLLETPTGTGTIEAPKAGSRPESPIPSGPLADLPARETASTEGPTEAPQSGVRTLSSPSSPSSLPTGSADEPLQVPALKTSLAQEPSAVPSPEGGDVTETGDISGESGGEPLISTKAWYEQTGTAVAGEGPAPEPVSEPGVSSAGPAPAGSGYTPGVRPELDRSPDSPDTIPRDEDLPEYRPVVPADPDTIPIPHGESPTGAGTDLPMAWDHSREWKKPAGQPTARNEPSGPVSAAPGGLFARIIALVTGIFRRK